MNHLMLLAEYNAWANNRIYTACSFLTKEEYHQPRKCFFGSIHHTLNHILVVDKNWLNRLEGSCNIVGDPATELFNNLKSLEEERSRDDERLIRLVSRFSESDLKKKIPYRFAKMNPDVPFFVSSNDNGLMPIHVILLTLFNHHAHHRGQVHCLLSQTAVPPPNIDIIGFYAKGQSSINLDWEASSRP
jgi:uncharacterized damage-inducible protein DinB